MAAVVSRIRKDSCLEKVQGLRKGVVLTQASLSLSNYVVIFCVKQQFRAQAFQMHR